MKKLIPFTLIAILLVGCTEATYTYKTSQESTAITVLAETEGTVETKRVVEQIIQKEIEQTTQVTTQTTTEQAIEEVTQPQTERTTEAATEQTTEAATEQTTEAATEQTTEAATEQTTEATTAKIEVTYVLNKNTKKIHYSSCRSAKTIKENNRATFTGNKDELLAQGYVPCKICNP